MLEIWFSGVHSELEVLVRVAVVTNSACARSSPSPKGWSTPAALRLDREQPQHGPMPCVRRRRGSVYIGAKRNVWCGHRRRAAGSSKSPLNFHLCHRERARSERVRPSDPLATFCHRLLPVRLLSSPAETVQDASSDNSRRGLWVGKPSPARTPPQSRCWFLE